MLLPDMYVMPLHMTTSRLWPMMSFIGSIAESESLSNCVMVYKYLHNKVLGYLQELRVPVNMNTHHFTLRSASDFQLIVSGTKAKAGKRAFSVTGSRWMEQPTSDCETIAILSSFKRQIKTYLFKGSFSS